MSRHPGGLLLLTATLDSGGAERVLVNLANGCAPRVRTTLVVLGGGEALRNQVDPSVEVADLHCARVRDAALPLVRLVRRVRPEVVVASQAHVTLLLALIRPWLPRGLRTIVREADLRTGRGMWDRGMRVAHRTVYRAHDVVLATSNWMAEDLARRRRGAIEVLPNPVDEQALRTAAGSAPVTGTTDGRRFVHVGRLVTAKRAHEVVTAFAAAARAADTLTLVGDGPERERIAALVRQLRLEGQVHLTGYDPFPARRIAAADLLVLASPSEGMPNVVLEALAVGTPVLATDELVTLRGLSAALPVEALRLVPRSGLALALAEHDPLPRPQDGAVRPSLLPAEHRAPAVIDRFLRLAFPEGTARAIPDRSDRTGGPEDQPA